MTDGPAGELCVRLLEFPVGRRAVPDASWHRVVANGPCVSGVGELWTPAAIGAGRAWSQSEQRLGRNAG